jgi:hypothetical protein
MVNVGAVDSVQSQITETIKAFSFLVAVQCGPAAGNAFAAVPRVKGDQSL